MTDDFPFRLEETRNEPLKRGIQKSFERLVAEQDTIKRWPMNERRINKLVNDLNGFMINTGAMWTIVNNDLSEGQFFLRETKILMPSIRSLLYHETHTSQRQTGTVNLNHQPPIETRNRYDRVEDTGSMVNKTSNFFRPWQ